MKPAVAAMPPVAAATQPAGDVPHAGPTTVGKVSEGAEHEFWPSMEKEARVAHALACDIRFLAGASCLMK